MLVVRRCKCVIAIGAAGVNYTEFDSNILIFDYGAMEMNVYLLVNIVALSFAHNTFGIDAVFVFAVLIAIDGIVEIAFAVVQIVCNTMIFFGCSTMLRACRRRREKEKRSLVRIHEIFGNSCHFSNRKNVLIAFQFFFVAELINHHQR